MLTKKEKQIALKWSNLVQKLSQSEENRGFTASTRDIELELTLFEKEHNLDEKTLEKFCDYFDQNNFRQV